MKGSIIGYTGHTVIITALTDADAEICTGKAFNIITDGKCNGYILPRSIFFNRSCLVGVFGNTLKACYKNILSKAIARDTGFKPKIIIRVCRTVRSLLELNSRNSSVYNIRTCGLSVPKGNLIAMTR